MDRPEKEIKDLRTWGPFQGETMLAVLAYLDWLEGKSVVEWPKELTRERLEGVSNSCDSSGLHNSAADIRALAAIAPERKKRVVNLWRNGMNQLQEWPVEWVPNPTTYIPEKWKLVARNIELEE